MKISEAFEPGHRKTTLAVLALVGSILLDQFGGGLSPDLKDFILSVLGIFVGGNVASKAIFAAKEIKLAKIPPSPQEQAEEPEQEVAEDTHNRMDAMQQFILDLNGGVNAKFNQIDQALALQAENTNKLIEMINRKK